MASKKQLAWRKKFAKMAKAGKFKKKKKRGKSKEIPTRSEEEVRRRPETGGW